MSRPCFYSAKNIPRRTTSGPLSAESAQGDREHSTGELDASGVSEAPESCKQ
jgi:hypothetical protein